MANLTTLASGSSVTLTVTDQQNIVLNNGRTDVARLSITTGPRAGRVITASHNGRQVYGPFEAGTITLAAVSGNVAYELSGDATSPLDDDQQPLIGAENATVRALVSGGGKVVEAVLFGTSLTASGWVGPDSVTLDATQNTLSARGLPQVANMLLGSPFKFIRNAGVSGNTLAQMRARFETDVTPYAAAGRVLFIEGGVNELPLIVGGASDPTAAAALADFEWMVGRAVELGFLVVAMTAPPANFYVTGANISARNNYLQKLNAGIMALRSTSQRVITVDVYATVVDTTAAYPTYLTASTYDNLHYNCNGAMQGGREIAREITAAGIIRQPARLGTSRSDFQNLVYNPNAAGNNASGANGYTNGTGITGQGPDGWTNLRTGTATGVASVATRAAAGYTDGKQGQFARIAVTGGALNDLVGWRWTLGTSGVNWAATTAYPVSRVRMPTVSNGFRALCIVAGTTAGTEPVWPTTDGATITDGTVTWAMQRLLVPGDQIEMSCEFGLNGWTGTALVEAQISFTGSSYVINGNLVFSGDSPPVFVPTTGTLAMYGTVPTGTTNVILSIYCAASAAGTGNFDLSSPQVRLVV